MSTTIKIPKPDRRIHRIECEFGGRCTSPFIRVIFYNGTFEIKVGRATADISAAMDIVRHCAISESELPVDWRETPAIPQDQKIGGGGEPIG